MSCECTYVLSSLRNALGRGCWPTFFPAQVQVAEEGHGASLAFLAGALSRTTPSSRTWGSFRGEQAGFARSAPPEPQLVSGCCASGCRWSGPVARGGIDITTWTSTADWGVRVSKKPSRTIRMHGLLGGKAWVLWALFTVGAGFSFS